MTDDDLRDRLRRADPAASLAPLPPGRVSQLLEESMSAAPARRRLMPLLAAAALLLVVGAGWLIFRPQPAGPAVSSAVAVQAHLTGADDSRVKCVEPTASYLAANADFAVAGTVTAIDADGVKLQVSKVYKGSAATEVLVGPEPGHSETLLGSGRFELGKNYLLASNDGAIMICGYSGEADVPGLLEMFEEAF